MPPLSSEALAAAVPGDDGAADVPPPAAAVEEECAPPPPPPAFSRPSAAGVTAAATQRSSRLIGTAGSARHGSSSSSKARKSVSSGEGIWLAQARTQERRRSSAASRRSTLTKSLSSRASFSVSHRHRSLNLSSSRSGKNLLQVILSGGGADGSGSHEELVDTADQVSVGSIHEDPFSTPPRPEDKEDDKEQRDDKKKEEAEKRDNEFASSGPPDVLLACASHDRDAVEMSFAGGGSSPKQHDLETAPPPPISDEKKNPAADNGEEEQEQEGSAIKFSTCTIRYYSTVIGDNPFVSSGPSLSLGWEYDPSATDTDVPLSVYEASRSAHLRRSGWDLVLSRAERERRLLDAGYSRLAIANGVREVTRIKNQRRRTVLNLKLSGAEEWMEGWSRAIAKGVGVRRSSHSMYNEWKRCGLSESLMSKRSPAPGIGSSSDPMAVTGHVQKMSDNPLLEISSVESEDASPKKRVSSVSIRQRSERVFPTGPAFGITQHRTASLRGRLLLDGPLPPKEEEEKKKMKEDVDDEEQEEPVLSSEEDGEERDGAPVAAAEQAKEKEEPTTKPFAVIELVHPDSPASEGGFRVGDRIVNFGGATVDNHRNLRAITDLGQAAFHGERVIPVSALRKEEEVLDDSHSGSKRDDEEEGNEKKDKHAVWTSVELTIRPREWKGAGHYGFLLKRC